MPRQLTAIQVVVRTWKVATGWDAGDKGWDQFNFARCAKAASSLLAAFGGSHQTANLFMLDLVDYYREKNLRFKLETIAQRAWIDGKMFEEKLLSGGGDEKEYQSRAITTEGSQAVGIPHEGRVICNGGSEEEVGEHRLLDGAPGPIRTASPGEEDRAEAQDKPAGDVF